MIVGITNTPRDYAWGSRGGISALFHRAPTDDLEAELWLGAHHGSPTRILDPELTGGAADLVAWASEQPQTVLGRGRDRFPFLLKILAADAPLSLQAHPTTEQAREGFARENAAGIPLTAPHRNYRDPHAKPELILAVSDRFRALCGFRPVAQSRAALERLLALAVDRDAGARAGIQRILDRLDDDGSLTAVVAWLLARGDGVEDAVAAVSRVAEHEGGEFDTQARLAREYPSDPGIVVSLLLHEVVLARGEALFLPAGNIHAYVAGVGVELMEASDNVLRGGLTPKHIDVPELLSVLDTTPRDVPWLRPQSPGPGVRVFRPEGVGFELVEIVADAPCPLGGPAIALCIAGEFTLTGARSGATVRAGDAVFVTPDEGDLTVSGRGQLVVATTTR